jgi:2-phosphosulfolactate phosphatase
VAQAAAAAAGEGVIAVIPAGELWPDGGLRPAVEDWLGAGAVIQALEGPRDAEASLACAAYREAGPGLAGLIRDCRSGQELIHRGFEADLDIALEMGAGRATPRLVDGVYVDVSGHAPTT